MADPGAISIFLSNWGNPPASTSPNQFQRAFRPAVRRRTSVTPEPSACVQDALTEDAQPISLLARPVRTTRQGLHTTRHVRRVFRRLAIAHALSSPSVSTPPSTSPSWCRCMLAHSPLAMNYYSSDLSYYAARNDESFYDQQQPQQRTERESPLAEPASGPSAASYTGGYKDEPDTPG